MRRRLTARRGYVICITARSVFRISKESCAKPSFQKSLGVRLRFKKGYRGYSQKRVPGLRVSNHHSTSLLELHSERAPWFRVSI